MPVSKPWTQFPRADNLDPQTLQCLDYMLTQLNQLVGQTRAPSGTGLQTFGANIINPTSAQIVSSGSRTASIATSITFTTTTTSVTFYWDGTNGSQAFKIYRDDNTITGPTIVGSPFTVTGLSPSTTYFFYFYWDETLQLIKPALVAGVGIGSPACAFTSANILAAQQQILRGRIALSPNLSSTGVTTPGVGTGSGSGGTGGGAGGWGFCPLQGAPVRLYGQKEWWWHSVEDCEDFLEIKTNTGREGTFSMQHRIYTDCGIWPMIALKFGDKVLTEDGEEKLVSVRPVRIPGGKVDRYEAQRGHVFSAWGFISHNVKSV